MYVCSTYFLIENDCLTPRFRRQGAAFILELKLLVDARLIERG